MTHSQTGKGEKMVINRVFARANKWTFQIKPISDLLDRYIGDEGRLWADPYAGTNKRVQFINDINPERGLAYCKDALDFCKELPAGLDGVLFDPPYSYRQVSEHYKAVGRKPTYKDTSYNFYARVLNPLGHKLKKGGIAISFGWNTNGFGKKRGFKIIEILIVAHGLHHNDTIITVEEKIL